MHSEFSIPIFIRDIEADFKRINDYAYNEAFGEYHQDQLKPNSFFRRMHMKMIFAFEALGQKTVYDMYLKEAEPLLATDIQIEWDHEEDWPYFSMSRVIYRYTTILACQMEEEPVLVKEESRDFCPLENILHNTHRILYLMNVEPSNEQAVKVALYEYLSIVYPDIDTQPVMNQVLKNYKPDCGIRKLRAAIEYKFVDTKEKAKTWLGQLHEDMQGYKGSEFYDRFYAVIFMTAPFCSTQMINAAVERHGKADSWKIIPVLGAGAEKIRKQRKMT